jgi:predicted TIM-barrel fold metal-dependent hydrolase
MAAMAASGRYGDCRVAAGIVASANLCLGSEVAPVLEAQLAAGNGRLKGIRFPVAYSDTGLFGRPPDPTAKGILLDSKFHQGVQALQSVGLSLDVWCLHTQLGELAQLADACPNVTIILDHLGTPLQFDAHLGAQATVFAQWRSALIALARRPNVLAKIGGLGMDVTRPIGGASRQAGSSTLAGEWRPYVEACIEAFGVQRCMFASNFPVDASTCSYGALWNAFKLIAANYSTDEKAALFRGTAELAYRLDTTQ